MLRRPFLTAVALALAACGEQVTVRGPGARSPITPPPPYVTASTPAQNPAASALPADVPLFRSGKATMRLGGVQARLGLGRLAPSTLAGGVLSVSYGDPIAGAFLNISGRVRPGAMRTGPSLALSLGNGGVVVAAVGDECRVVFQTLEPDALRGRFSCSGLSSPGGRVDASGTFRASS